MEFEKTLEGATLTLALTGRLVTTTAPLLENELNESLAGIKKLVLDFKGVEYVSSAGLRVLLTTQQTMNRQGEMVMKNVSDDILHVLEITGFTSILTIE